MEDLGKGMLAGFAATVVLSAIMVMKELMGLMPQLDVIGMLSGMFAMSRGTGWLIHFGVGTVLYGLAIALVTVPLPGGAIVAGMLIASAGWLVMMVALMPMAGHGLFGANLGLMAPVMTLMLHLIFGAVLGWTYGKLGGRRAEVHDSDPSRAQWSRGPR